MSPETVKGWSFDPEYEDHYEVPDMSRWPIENSDKNGKGTFDRSSFIIFRPHARPQRTRRKKMYLCDLCGLM
jgi:hypothetical protein